jgi:hypothetical protein
VAYSELSLLRKLLHGIGIKVLLRINTFDAVEVRDFLNRSGREDQVVGYVSEQRVPVIWIASFMTFGCDYSRVSILLYGLLPA